MTRIILVSEVGQERAQPSKLRFFSLIVHILQSPRNTSLEEIEAPSTCARMRRRIKKKCYQNISIFYEWT